MDKAVEMGILGLVDHTQTASAEFLKDAVVRDRLSDERLGFRHVALILGCARMQVNEDTKTAFLKCRSRWARWTASSPVAPREMEAAGISASGAPVTVEDAIEKFTTDANARGLRKSTLRKYDLLHRTLIAFCQKHGWCSCGSLMSTNCEISVPHGN
jgi:hypothetical protein